VKVGGKVLPHTIPVGGGFGELALFYEEPRSATVFAKEPTSTWILDKKTFRGGLARRVEEMCSENAKFLMEVPFFKEFEGDTALPQYIQKVAEAMVPAEFSTGDYIIRQGEEGNTFYIIKEGTCNVIVDGKTKDHTLTAGNWFGEKALVGESAIRTASIVATTDVKCIGMDRSAFTEHMGSFEVFRNTHSSEQNSLGSNQTDCPKLDLEDYEFRRVLGVGGFGLVTLHARKSDGKLFALKKMQKQLIVEEEMQKFVRQEKMFLAELNGNLFVPTLDGTARDDDNVYLMLEFLSGGDLFSLIEECGSLNESTVVRFTAACAILGLQHVHKHSIAFRDLKLENLVIAGNGYVKLVDFGLAKRILARSYTFCGSPRYCAPEMVTGKGHNKAIDWWALG
jgi:CRP-like cAMP-binding protein